MRRSSRNLPTDPNKLAYEIVRLSIEEPEEPEKETPQIETPAPRSVISEYLAEIGRKGGLKGGKARAEKLTVKQRKEIAQNAALARWRKLKQTPSS